MASTLLFACTCNSIAWLRLVGAPVPKELDALPGLGVFPSPSRIVRLRSSTSSAHSRVSKTSLDGSVAPLGHPPSGGAPAAQDVAGDPPPPPTRSTWSASSECTNRKAAIVASISGRASTGLQVRIFRRSFSLRVVEGRVGRDARGAVAAGRLVRLVVEEVVEVEVRVREGEGLVTNHTIVFRSAGVGRREKPAFKDIAICVNGRRQMERAAQVDASTKVSWQ